LGLDLSGNKFFLEVIKQGRPIWSDTFLSVIGGGLSVALAIPSKDRVVIGEIDLSRLTKFLKKVTTSHELTIMVIDSSGQVIADQDGRYTAQQLNVSNIPLVKQILKSSGQLTGPFEFNNRSLIGSLIQIPSLKWVVLVAQPIEIAYRSLWTTMGITAAGLLASVILGISVALYLARRLGRRFEELTDQAGRLAAGEDSFDWPRANITEFQHLSSDLQEMAGTIRERERQLFTLMSNLPGMVYRCRNDMDWTIEFISQGSLALTGYASEILLNNDRMSFNDLIHPDDQPWVSDEIRDHLSRKEPYQVVYRLKTAEGRFKWVLNHGQGVFSSQEELLALEGFMNDITEPKRAEEILQTSERRYSQAISGTSDAIWEWDLDSNKTFYSPRWYEMLGYSDSMFDMNFDTWEDLCHSEDVQPTIDRIQQALSEPESKGYEVEFRMRAKAGDWRWILGRGKVVKRDYKGRPLILSGTNTDITDRLRAEEEKEKLQAQLRQAQKMEAIGTLAGGIAHDFNNLLTVIIGCTELGLMNLSVEDPTRQHLIQVQQAGKLAADLVQQILSFSRQTEQEPNLIQPAVIVKEALKMLRASVPTTIQIQQDIERDQGTILADPTNFHQILMNLCTNAAHAMGEKGGVLKITLGKVQVEVDEADHYPELNPGPYIKLSVSDTGHGIEPKVLDHIFDPYFTTKKLGEGTGLGLAVVFGIVKSYQGDIKVRSELGKGSTFEVLLPRVDYSQQELKFKGPETIPGGKEKILLVDDEEALVYTVQKTLESLGYQVTTRTSSLEALEIFRAGPDEFDLIITDMTMPNLDGIGLSKRIRQIRAEIPIIICTGYSERITEEIIKSLGIQALVMKPIVRGMIAETIRKVLDRRE
jgi:PAS domain S-box-containing protein